MSGHLADAVGRGVPSAMASISTELMMLTPTLVGAVFMFVFGACVGSFLNVVAYRLPMGRSVVSPPSRCPACGARLRWYDNLPVLGWLLLRGRCRRCRRRISLVYPVVEVLVGLLFAAIYLTLYLRGLGDWGEQVGGEWWRRLGFAGTWPACIVILTLFGCIVVATLVDAKTFLIPASITNVLCVVAVAGWGLQSSFSNTRWGVAVEGFPLPPISAGVAVVVLGMLLGLCLSTFLLWSGRLRRSFDDYEDYVAEGDVLAEYPHARREMGREILFLLPMVAGGGIGTGVAIWTGAAWTSGPQPQVWSVLAAVGLGWLVGGGLVWGVRILGTLAFGREAMGMGDVHLLAAIGAALGWVDPIRIFFIAPFLALGWVLFGRIATAIGGKGGRELPYGPHLAAATLVIWFGRPLVDWFETSILLPPP